MQVRIKYATKLRSYLSCHNLGEFGRVFESKLSYFFVLVVILLEIVVTVVHVGIVKDLVIHIEVGERGKRVSGITATRVKRRG
jgi:hypothetical protein